MLGRYVLEVAYGISSIDTALESVFADVLGKEEELKQSAISETLKALTRKLKWHSGSFCSTLETVQELAESVPLSADAASCAAATYSTIEVLFQELAVWSRDVGGELRSSAASLRGVKRDLKAAVQKVPASTPRRGARPRLQHAEDLESAMTALARILSKVDDEVSSREGALGRGMTATNQLAIQQAAFESLCQAFMSGLESEQSKDTDADAAVALCSVVIGIIEQLASFCDDSSQNFSQSVSSIHQIKVAASTNASEEGEAPNMADVVRSRSQRVKAKGDDRQQGGEESERAGVQLVFLEAQNSIEETLGSVVLSQRGDSFSRIADIEDAATSNGTQSTYSLAVSSLSHLFRVAMAPDSPLGLHFIVRYFGVHLPEADEESALKFTYIEDPSEENELPSVGWRRLPFMEGDEEKQVWCTSYAFLRFSHPVKKNVLLLHDVVSKESESYRSEIVHWMEECEAERNIKVTAYGACVFLKGVAKTRSNVDDVKSFVERWRRSLLKLFPGQTSPPAPMTPTKGMPGSHPSSKQNLSNNSVCTAPVDPVSTATAVAAAAAAQQSANSAKRSIGGRIMDSSVALTKAVVDAPLTAGKFVVGVANTAMRSTQEGFFRKSFPDNTEELLELYNCALNENGLLRQGFLFLTKSKLCFQGTVLAAHIAVDVDDVQNMTKEKTASFFDNAVMIETKSGTTFLFASFLQRDDAFKVLRSWWSGKLAVPQK